MKKIKGVISIFFITLLVIQSVYAQGLSLIVDGQNLTELASPFIIDNRTMVPIRFISEALETEVYWDETLQKVDIKRDALSLTLWIGSRVYLLNGQYYVSDVAPKIINNRTYVPVRLVANAFEVGVLWNGDKQEVTIDSNIKDEQTLFYDLDINISDYQKIEGMTQITSNYNGAYDHVEIMVIDPETSKGYIRSREASTTIDWYPRMEDQGQKLLAYVIKDESNQIIQTKVVPVNIQIIPDVQISYAKGAETNAVEISAKLNFEARYLDYVITPKDKDAIRISERDPYDSYTYQSDYKNNGIHSIQVIAYDKEGNPYPSHTVDVSLYADRYFYLSGVSNNQTINQAVKLIGYRNFDVTNTKFYMKNPLTQEVKLLSDQPWGSYTYQPTKEDEGTRILYMTVLDVSGRLYTTPEKTVVIDMSPKMYLKGVGPDQIVTDELSLSLSGNISPDEITYYVLNSSDQLLLEQVGETFNFKPGYSTTYKIYASYTFEGKIYETEKVTFKGYVGTLFGSKPIVAKEEFQDLASSLAVAAMKDTGMSASLQTAQAILETGWGQKLPVDKYSGQMSYNLFGIKGTGTIGSVISNTWEVYNGVSYRVDDYFRAYNNIEESWADHKKILLNLSRYAPYRAVMYDSTKGAWAIRRCGYATDPKYPMKLIRIIDQYDLEILDQIQL